ncbi:MAG: ABC transporter permease [Planctomycetota bacterium]|jgi:ABC-2 type transport system permease protein
MLRYLRLYAYFLRFSFSRAMHFRLDFFFRIGMDIMWNAMHITFFTVLFAHTGLLGGWNYDQVLIFAGALFVSDAINMTVFSNNTYWLPIAVNRGDLDYYLVRPVASLFFLSLRDFAANSFVNLLIAVGILTWAVARYPEPIPAGRMTLFVVFLVAGSVLNWITYMIFIIPVFWLQSPGGLRETYWSLSSMSSRPHRIFTGWVLRVVVSFLPFAFVVSIPAMVLIEGATPTLLLHGTAVLVGMFGAMLLFWRTALRSYSSASS